MPAAIRLYVLLSVLLISLRSFATQDSVKIFSDSINSVEENNDLFIERELEELEVIVKGRNSINHQYDRTIIDAGKLQTQARVFGEPDIVALLKQESGVNSTSDYGSGIAYEGADPYQCLYRIDGAPVFFPYRFGGIFSIFNTSHYGKTVLWRNEIYTDHPVRLGPTIDLNSRNPIEAGKYLMMNLGVLSSSGSIQFPVSKKFGVSISGRLSYLNLLYNKMLEVDKYALGYDFADLNVSMFWQLNSKSQLTLSGFYNGDRLDLQDKSFDLDMNLNWQNKLLTGVYKGVVGDYDIETKIYSSAYNSSMGMSIPGINTEFKSSIGSYGFSGKVKNDIDKKWLSSYGFYVGADFNCVNPQRIEGNGIGYKPAETNIGQWNSDVRGGFETQFELPFKIKINFGSSIDVYSTGNHYTKWSILPWVSLRKEVGISELSLSGKWAQQALHQVGFSEIGLASNYWLGSSSKFPVETGKKISLNWVVPIPLFNLKFYSDIYFSTINNQLVYMSNVLDVLNFGNAEDQPLLPTEGYNYGCSGVFLKDVGDITGKASVSYLCSKRKFDGSGIWWRGEYDSGLRASASLAWTIDNHWSLGAMFEYHSGRVYTPVRAIYLISGNIATEYGNRNSKRLPSYQRLDLSATYILPVGNNKMRHLFNFSLINAYGHRNVEMQYYSINTTTNQFYLNKLYSMYRFLPSISYTLEIK